MKRISFLMAALCLCAALLAGCGQNMPQLDKSALQYDIASITAPEGTRIVSLGEASHGASDLQRLKGDVFKALVENNGCRVFAIEGDFGGCAKVDAYIHGGPGTAEEAVAQIGFRIYRTQELADLVQWMRAYNETAPESDALHFVGFDLQRYDNSKALLLDYLRAAAPPLAADYEARLASLTDKAMYTLQPDAITAAEADLTALRKAMQTEIPSAQQDDAFAFALQCAQSMLENTQLRAAGTQYNTLRDAAMKQKVDWICAQYSGMVFLNGHNGHIAKVSSAGYDCMGAQLTQTYGNAYFAIGTDVRECRFNGQSGDDYKVFTVKNENALTAQLEGAPGNGYYLDFAAVANDSAWQTVLNAPQKMLGLNVSFAGWQALLKPLYTMSIVPQDSYDALLVLQTTTPTQLLG